MAKSYYIITIHNREDLIEQVLQGILKSHDYSQPGEIVAVIDGCTDGTEAVIDEVNKRALRMSITKLYASNVHEIAALNHALTYIRTDCNPDPNDLIFMLQDDVILEEEDINRKLENLYKDITDLGYVSFRMGVNTIFYNDELCDYDVIESEYGHWKQLEWTHVGGKPITFLRHNEILFRGIVVRSPAACIWKHFASHGVFDAALCPYNYDCFDFSIRMLQAGYRNAVVGYKFRSDVDWGGMRKNKDNEVNKKAEQIFNRNLNYLIEKHKRFLTENNVRSSK